MWHEARKQERKIRGLMVDYKKRAERRREFYEKIKLDPAQFVHVYGRPYKIHLDPATAMAAEGPQSMMPWQGQTNNMIDRFDVRAHLDFIPETDGKLTNPLKSSADEEEERHSNYERYRSLVENEAAGLTEEQSLHQIYLDEQFGPINHQSNEEEKKKSDNKAAIGFTYDDSSSGGKKGKRGVVEEVISDVESDESSDTDIEAADLDVTLDVDVLTPDQTVAINKCAERYGMKDDDFIRLLRKDKDEVEALRQAKLMEEEKAQFSGRKSRRERRAYKDKRLMGRKVSPPSYAARDSPKYEPYKKDSSSSRSRSRSPDGPAKVMFITSFGDEEEHPVQGPSLPVADNVNKTESKGKSRLPSNREDHTTSSRRRRSSSSSSRSRSRDRRSRSRNRRSGSSPKRSHYSSRKSKQPSDKYHHRDRSRSRSRKRSRSSSSRSRSSSYSSSSSYTSRSRSRRESLSSKSGSSSEEDRSRNNRNYSSKKTPSILSVGKHKTSSYSSNQSKLTPQEKMKRKMQAALSKQFKVDKKVELEKTEKSMQERMDREEDLRLRSLEMRRREREKRHKEMEEYDRDRSRSRSRSPVRSKKRSRSRSPRSRHSRRSRS